MVLPARIVRSRRKIYILSLRYAVRKMENALGGSAVYTGQGGSEACSIVMCDQERGKERRVYRKEIR